MELPADQSRRSTLTSNLARPGRTDELYLLAFTTGGLFRREAPLVATLYLALGDWNATRHQILSDNLLQVRTAAAGRRLSRELIARLALLDRAELEALNAANPRDLGYLLWAAACRRYAFIRDFAVEVLREFHLTRRRHLALADFDAFRGAKSLGHPELEAVTASTRRKLRQNLFRMMREADLLDDQGQIQPALLSPSLARLLARPGPASLLIFPASDLEIQRWLP